MKNHQIAIALLLLFHGFSCRKTPFKTNEVNLEKGLQLKFNFDGNISDVTGNYLAANNGALYVGGRKGNTDYAMSFDGVDDNILVAGAPLYFNEFTYNLWYKATQNPGSGTAYFLLTFGSSGADHDLAHSNNYGVSNGLVGGSSNDPGSPYVNTLAIPGTLADVDHWQMMTLVRSQDYLSLYINGKLVSSNTTHNTKPKYNRVNDVLTIGSRQSMFYTKGQIDDVSIYNRTLSSLEINELYRQ